MAYGTACLSSLEEMASLLGTRPEVVFNGAIDNAISQRIADSLLAVLREALTNAGKHAKATSYIVTISVADDVSLEVQDNGIGIELPQALWSWPGTRQPAKSGRKVGRKLRDPDGRRRDTASLARARLVESLLSRDPGRWSW